MSSIDENASPMGATQQNFYDNCKDRAYRAFDFYSKPIFEYDYSHDVSNVMDVIQKLYDFIVQSIPDFFTDLHHSFVSLNTDVAWFKDKFDANINTVRHAVESADRYYQGVKGLSVFAHPRDCSGVESETNVDRPVLADEIRSYFMTHIERFRMEEEDRSSQSREIVLREQRQLEDQLLSVDRMRMEEEDASSLDQACVFREQLRIEAQAVSEEQLRIQQHIVAQRDLAQQILDDYSALRSSRTGSGGISFSIFTDVGDSQNAALNPEEQYDLLCNIFTAYTRMRRNDPNYDRSERDFMDPISQEFFRTPIIASDRRTYELSTLQDWCNTQSQRGLPFSSPMDRQRLNLQVAHDMGLIDEMIEAITWYRDEVAQNPDVLRGPGRV